MDDPEQADQELDNRAYGLATKAGDMDAASELHQAITARGARISARMNNPTKDMSGGERFAAGMGQGAAKVADFNLPHMDNEGGSIPEQPSARPLYTDPTTDKALLDTTGGKLGSVAGQVAATLPIGGAGGGLTKALMATKLGGNLAGRVAARAGVAGLEGGASNAASGEDAGEGALAGAAMSPILGTAGRVVKGLVNKSPAADRLYQDAAEEGKELFIPISQGGTGPAKALYKNVLPYALGAEAQMKNQSGKAKEVISSIAAEHGMPSQVDSSGKLVKTPAPVGDTMEQTAQDMRSSYDRAYQNTVKDYAFKPPENFHSSVLDNLSDTNLPSGHKQQIASTLDSILQDHLDSNGNLSGENLLRAKAAGREALGNLKSAGGLYKIGNEASTNKAIGSIDDIVQDTIDKHKSMGSTPGAAPVVRDLENFQKLGPAYAQGNAVASTAEGNIANRGQLKFGKLAENAPANTPLRSMAQDAHDVLENESPGGVNPAGRHAAALAGTALPIAAFTGHLPAAAAVLGAGNLAATKSVQKGLYGDTAVQQALARALRKNPNAAHLTSYALRQGVNDASGQ